MSLRAEGLVYTPSRRDVLWLLRAVAAEGPPHADVARALVSGFFWARARRGATYDLATWVRRYSQPVNPKWLPGGELYEQRLQAAREANDEAAVDKLEQRAQRRIRASRRTEFPGHVVAAVQAALAEGTRQPVTDFAASWVEPTQHRVPLTPVIPGENRFFTRDDSWSGYAGAGMELARKLVGKAAEGTGGPGVAIALLMFGFLAWRAYAA